MKVKNIFAVVAILLSHSITAFSQEKITTEMILAGGPKGSQSINQPCTIQAIDGKIFTCKFSGGSVIKMSVKETETMFGVRTFEGKIMESTNKSFSLKSTFVFTALKKTGNFCAMPESSSDKMQVLLVSFEDGSFIYGMGTQENKNISVMIRDPYTNYVFDQKGKILESDGAYKKGTKSTLTCLKYL